MSELSDNYRAGQIFIAAMARRMEVHLVSAGGEWVGWVGEPGSAEAWAEAVGPEPALCVSALYLEVADRARADAVRAPEPAEPSA